MQQSSIVLFCKECGTANDPLASVCVVCQHVLESMSAPVPQAAPVSIAPSPAREVIVGTASSNPRLPLELLPGTLLFGHYQVCSELGRGGFSVVYLAEDLVNRRLVAIKRIHLYTLSPHQIIAANETCNREIKILGLLRGVEGVPEFYESFTDPENWYLIMEYILGRTLDEYMQRQPGDYLLESQVIELGLSLTTILQNLHAFDPTGVVSGERYIIFRDLKPSNIMITPVGKLYLIDFGIARFFTPGQQNDTAPLGSLGYAPPEQYGHAQTDARADIYSLGVTLQTLLTGRDPLDLAQGELPRNSRPISRRLHNLLVEMMAVNVERRPATMQEIKKRLTRMQRFLPAARKVRWLSFGIGVLAGFLGSICFYATVKIGVPWLLGPLVLAMLGNKKRLLARFTGPKPQFKAMYLFLGFGLGMCLALVFGVLVFVPR